MLDLIFDLYLKVFGRKYLQKISKFLFLCSIRGMGILNYKNVIQSGERKFIKSLNIDDGAVVVDIGANKGGYIDLVLEENRNAKFFAFEPHPLTFDCLSKHFQSQNLDIELINMGVSSKNGDFIIYDYKNNDGSEHASIYKDVIEKLHHHEVAEHKIKLIRLDDFIKIKKIKKIDLLKIDTEGNELEVLRGAEDAIRSNKIAVIHFEFNSMNVFSKVFFRDFMEILPNYKFYRMLPGELLEIVEYDPLFCELFAYQNIIAVNPNLYKI